jgi:nickel/cobalt transporter (NiCoT) family protein
MTITCVSAIVAFAIGGIELLGLLVEKFRLQGLFAGSVAYLDQNLGALSYLFWLFSELARSFLSRCIG